MMCKSDAATPEKKKRRNIFMRRDLQPLPHLKKTKQKKKKKKKKEEKKKEEKKKKENFIRLLNKKRKFSRSGEKKQSRTSCR